MKKIIVTSLTVFLSLLGYSQEKKIEKANKEYDNYAYFEAKDIYEKVANKGHKSIDLFEKLGDSYYFNADLVSANKWYSELFALDGEKKPEYYFRYAQTLKAVQDYKKADEYFKKFSELNASDLRAKKFTTQSENYLEEIKKNSNRYAIENAGINSKYSDFGATFFKDQLVFTSARDTGSLSSNKHTWTNQAFTNLYSSKVNSDGSLSKPERFSSKLNSKVNESTPTFTQDGGTIYFTRNNYTNGKKGKDANNKILLKIYKAKFDGLNWGNEVEVPFNSDEYNVAHPTLSPDDKYLYFASNMPGTFGSSDLYRVLVNTDGTFGTPENLGDYINTEGRETFPFISDDNVLYFASDGHLGLGGLDVFGVKINDDGSFGQVMNLGFPLNSNLDDFCYMIDNTTKFGFVSSNRTGGEGYDDIYKFKEKIPLELNPKQEIMGLVEEDETEEPIENAKVTLFNEKMEEIGTTYTDKNGNYTFEKLNPDQNYIVRIESKDNEVAEKIVRTSKGNGKTFFDVKTPKRVKKVGVGSDLAKTFKIEIIYFDLDKANIRKDAAVDLAKIVEVMKQNPTMKVDVRSHTDCRQTAAYNLKLSDKRAKATIAWMVNQGISADRLTGKGYGESQLVNDCGCEPKNDSPCSEADHQKNRRSEFIITAM